MAHHAPCTRPWRTSTGASTSQAPRQRQYSEEPGKDEHEKFCSKRVAAEKSDGWRKVRLEFATSVSGLARKLVSKAPCSSYLWIIYHLQTDYRSFMWSWWKEVLKQETSCYIRHKLLIKTNFKVTLFATCKFLKQVLCGPDEKRQKVTQTAINIKIQDNLKLVQTQFAFNSLKFWRADVLCLKVG